jgi:hypothetical protein
VTLVRNEYEEGTYFLREFSFERDISYIPSDAIDDSVS